MTLFVPPTQTTLHYRIVTPMFLGGESQQADAQQFRNASFKGALRFWWRALNWGKAFKEKGPQTADALMELHKREGALFGLASDGKDSQQSRVQISSELKRAVLKPQGMALESVGYLLGQGLFHFRDGVLRKYVEGGELTICLSFKPAMDEADIKSVEQAAIALGLLGGLGSRSRKGLGSLALQKIERQGQPVREFNTIESIAAFIQSLDFSAPAEAPFSALSQSTRIDVSATAGAALAALKTINDELQLYRSFGLDGLVQSFGLDGKKTRQKVEPKFPHDHDNVRDAIVTRSGLQKMPDRAVFGLPHNYFFSGLWKKNEDHILELTAQNPERSGDATDGRRASPLLVHIHPLQNGQFIAIQTLLPTLFLPPDLGFSVNVGKPKHMRPVPAPAPKNTSVDYSVITRYLDGFANKKTLKAQHHG